MDCRLSMFGSSGSVRGIWMHITLSMMFIYLLELLSMRWRKYISGWGFLVVWLRNHCIGRYGYPTLGFNFICSHNRRIQHIISKPFHGATNDVTVNYYDNYPRSLMLCQEHTERVFRTFNRSGEVRIFCRWWVSYVL